MLDEALDAAEASASVNTFTADRKRRADSRSPCRYAEIMPTRALICFCASAWLRVARYPGNDLTDLRMALEERGDGLRRCSCAAPSSSAAS